MYMKMFIASDWAMNIIIHCLKIMVNVSSCNLYLLDVGTDIYGLHKLYYDPPAHLKNHWFINTTVIGHLSLCFIMLPFLITGLANLSELFRDPNKSALNKLWMTPVTIFEAFGIPFYYMVKNAHALVTGANTEGTIADRAALFKLIEALLEAYPQAAIQLTIICITGEAAWWQCLALTTSLLSLPLTIATSTYLFKDADVVSRVTFFSFGLLSAISRLMISISNFGFGIILLLVPTIVIWIVKRFCFCCCYCCCLNWLPLSSSHYRFSNAHHVVLSWWVTAFFNCFTLSGLLMSSLCAAWAGLWFHRFVVLKNANILFPDVFQGRQIPEEFVDRVAVFTTVRLILCLITLMANTILVLVPTYSNW